MEMNGMREDRNEDMQPGDSLISEAYRAAPRPEPPPALDAAILDAARRAAATAPRRRGRWFAWAVPLSTTAVLVLGITLLFQIQRQAPEALGEAPPPAAHRESAPGMPPGTPADLAGEPAAKATDAARPPRATRGAGQPAEARSAPTPAPAPASLPPAASLEAPALTQAAPEPRPFPAPAASAPQLEAARPAVPAAASANSTSRQADRLERAAPAAASAREGTPAFGQGVSKYKAASPAAESPEQWVEKIRQLVREGRSEAARKALQELRGRYPDYELPDDLRAMP
jgi:hypothetical protein